MHNVYRDKCAKLSLDQKIALLSGIDFWRTTSIPDIGIPQLKFTDGPNGARGDLKASVPAACFPVGVALGATWNPDLLAEVGSALADESKSKSAHVLLGPTINLQRTPIGGRNFECYSEDPYLTAELAIAYVGALQAKGIGACPKHYVGNDTEFERMTISSNIDAATLHEIYLYPFERVVKEAKPWMIMASYNAINGVQACSHRALNIGLLKDNWGFDGVIVSDWFAARDCVRDANGGLDLEMPGPTRIWGDQLASKVTDGSVIEAEINDKIDRILHLIERTGVAPNEALGPENSIDNPAHRDLIRRAGAEAIVLLKNDNYTLPLSPQDISSLAIIGPNAEVGQIMGGGSSFVNSHPPSHPLDALQAAYAGINIRYERGCTNYKYLPLFKSAAITAPNGTNGCFLREIFAGPDFTQEPAHVDYMQSSQMLSMDNFKSLRGEGDSTSRITGIYRAEDSGEYMLGLFSAGPSRMLIDDKVIIDNWNNFTPGESYFGFGSKEQRAEFQFEKGCDYTVIIEYLRPAIMPVAGLQFGIEKIENSEEQISRAVQAALDSDVTILILGSNADWESEGHDRETLKLPGEQDVLAEAVLAANPDTIIIMNVGAPVAMPWYEKAKTMLVAWFLGEEMGNALADVISGKCEPSGRLPFTWPKHIKDHPAFSYYPGKNGQMEYGEKRLVGHRWYDKKEVASLAPFGFGLGYGDVQIDAVSITKEDVIEDIAAMVTITARNISSRPTRTVLQIYAEAPAELAGIEDMPLRKLVAFKKVDIEANEIVQTSIAVYRHALAVWDVDEQDWTEPLDYTLVAGLSSAEIFE